MTELEPKVIVEERKVEEQTIVDLDEQETVEVKDEVKDTEQLAATK